MYVYLAVAILSAALSGIGAWKVQSWRYAAMEKDRIEQVAKEVARKADKIDSAAMGHEADKAQIRTVTKVITQQVEKIVREPFYIASDAPACFDDAGLQQLRAAVEGRSSAASEPKSAVQPAKPAR